MANTPEFLTLSAAFDTRWPAVVSRALKEQAELYDQTDASRSRMLTGLGMLVFVAVVVGLPAAFVLPDLARAAGAALRSLSAGSTEPFRTTVHWPAAVDASGLPELDLYVLLGSVAVLAVGTAWVTVLVVASMLSAYRSWRADLTTVVRWRLLDEYHKIANEQDTPVLQIRTARAWPHLTRIRSSRVPRPTSCGRSRSTSARARSRSPGHAGSARARCWPRSPERRRAQPWACWSPRRFATTPGTFCSTCTPGCVNWF